MGLKVQDRYFIDLSLLFGLRWTVSSCQDVTSLVVKSLKNNGVQDLSYINEFRVAVARDEALAWQHFDPLGATLSQLGLKEAAYKACPRAKVMTWLGFQFETEHVTCS